MRGKRGKNNGEASKRASAAIIGLTVGAFVFVALGMVLGAGERAIEAAGAAWAFLAITLWIVGCIADGGGKQ